MNVPTDYLGTLPQQITAISATGGVIWAVLRFGLGWRKQTLDSDEQVRQIMQEELAAVRAERAADSEKFARVEKHLREMVAQSDERHEECERSRREMRKEMDGMHSEVAGLRRDLAAQSVDRVLRLEGRPSEVAPHSLAAAERLKKGSEDEPLG